MADDTFLRRVQISPNFLSLDQATRKPVRPTSAAFKLHKGEEGVSVYSVSVLGGRSAVCLLHAVVSPSSWAIGALVESELSKYGFQALADPDRDDEKIGDAHFLIVNDGTLGKGAAARKLAEMVACVHPCQQWSELEADAA